MDQSDKSPSIPLFQRGNLSSAALARLWEEGQHSVVVRRLLDRWAEVLQADDLGWIQEPLRVLGLRVESFELQAETVRRRRQPHAWENLIRSVLDSGDPWWARELLAEAGTSTRALRALRVEVDLLLGDAADAIAAWVNEHTDAAAIDAAVGWWVRAGRIVEAERLLEANPGLTLWRARLALYRRDTAAARTLLRELPASPEVRCLTAVAAALDDRLEEAEAELRTLLDGTVRVEAWNWLATVLRKQGRYDEAVHAADVAKTAVLDFNLVLWLERWLAVSAKQLADYDGAQRVSTLSKILRWVGLAQPSVGAPISQWEHAWAGYLVGLKPTASVADVARLIERFGGNHTAHITTVDRGRLTAHPLPPDGGTLGSNLQLILRTRGAEATRALYRELAPSMIRFPRFRLFQGEVELWMGAYDDAARIFRDILADQRTVKWAWIGLGASAMLQGRLGEAQDIWAEAIPAIAPSPFDGPTLFIYRGECYRRQGAVELARRDLEFAVRQKPYRVSAWINLALLDGDEVLSARVEEKLTALAPLLMEELRESDAAAKWEHILEAMRGNRSSSCVSYHLWGRMWHFIPRGLEDLLTLLPAGATR